MSIKTGRVERYYDTHDVEGEELGQNSLHGTVIRYLIAVLEWLLQGQNVRIEDSLNFYDTPAEKEIPKCPDVAVVFEPLATQPELSSYTIREDGPPPAVAIEVASPGTWRVDLEIKPGVYAALGIKEYFVFDPHSKRAWNREWQKKGRLVGWKLDPTTNKYVELEQQDDKGRLWSVQLQSLVGIEDQQLRLYDAAGRLRLTQAEAEQQARLAERQQTEQLIEAERRQAQVERRQAQAERRQAQAERERAEKLAALIRQLGYNPDELLDNQK